MKIVIYIRNKSLEKDRRVLSLIEELEKGGCQVTPVNTRADIPEGTQMLLSVGGDGTFLSSAALVGDSGIPVLGINLGRLGFLSENRAEAVASALLRGEYTIEERTLLHAEVSDPGILPSLGNWPYALNEISVNRSGAAMLGANVSVNGVPLPTYWADGLLIATSSGSTAYSLSVGGPIVLPESKVLIISPIAPHNLNVRPLVVPNTAKITLGLKSRDSHVRLTMDNRTVEVNSSMQFSIGTAPFPLRRVCMGGSTFIDALVSKLFWGGDVRNSLPK